MLGALADRGPAPPESAEREESRQRVLALLREMPEIEACHSVAGEESYILKVRVPTPADLEALLQEIRAAANVSTRTTVVLSTPFEGRPPPL